MAVQTLEAKITANVSNYVAGLESAGTKAAMFGRSQLDMAANVRRMADAMEAMGKKAQDSGEQLKESGSKTVTFAAALQVAEKAAHAAREAIELTVGAANKMDPQGAHAWNKAVNDLKNSFLSLAGTVGKELRPVLESAMGTLTGWIHLIGRFDFKAFAKDVVAWAKDVADSISNLLGKIGSFLNSYLVQPVLGAAEQVVRFILWPFQALQQAIGEAVSGALDKMAKLADAAQKYAHVGSGGQGLREASVAALKASQADIANQIFGKLGDLKENAKQYGITFVQGVVNGVTSGGSGLLKQAKQALSEYLRPDTGQKDFNFAAADNQGGINEAAKKLAELNKILAGLDRAAAEATLSSYLKTADGMVQGLQSRAKGLQTQLASANASLASASGSGVDRAAQVSLQIIQQIKSVNEDVKATMDAQADKARAYATSLSEGAEKAKQDMEAAAETIRSSARVFKDENANEQQKAAASAAADIAKMQLETAKEVIEKQKAAAAQTLDLENKAKEQQRNADLQTAQQIADLQRAVSQSDRKYTEFAQGAVTGVAGATGLGGALSGAQTGYQVGGGQGAAIGALLGFVQQSKAIQDVSAKAAGYFQAVADALGEFIAPLLAIPGPLVLLMPALRAMGDAFRAASPGFQHLQEAFQRLGSGLLKRFTDASVALAIAFGSMAGRFLDAGGLLGGVGGLVSAVERFTDTVFLVIQTMDFWAAKVADFVGEILRSLHLDDQANVAFAFAENMRAAATTLADNSAKVTAPADAAAAGMARAAAAANEFAQTISQDFQTLGDLQQKSAADYQALVNAQNAGAPQAVIDALQKTYNDDLAKTKQAQDQKAIDDAKQAYANNPNANTYEAIIQAMAQLALDQATASADNTSATKDNTKATVNAVASLTNVPSGFKVALERFNSTIGLSPSINNAQTAIGAAQATNKAGGTVIQTLNINLTGVEADPRDPAFQAAVQSAIQKVNWATAGSPSTRTGNRFSTPGGR